MLPDVPWKVGFEIELMAPRGRSRRDLALAIAGPDGEVTPMWHMQSEPSRVPGMPVFENLTQGFRVARSGEWVATCVDDLTLQDGLVRDTPPRPGWFRVVSDDKRLLRLVQRHCAPTGTIAHSLAPLAALFGVEPVQAEGGIVRVSDGSGASVCLGAPLPGERERPCELVTCPLEQHHHAVLKAHLSTARAMGFTIPTESAVHIHCDAATLRTPAVFQRLCRMWMRHATAFKRLIAVNPRCVRLGPWSDAFTAAVLHPSFTDQSWDAAQAQLQRTQPSKFRDLNVANTVLNIEDKPTVEFRVFPGSLDAQRITAWAHLAVAMCRAAVEDADREHLIDLSTLSDAARSVLLTPTERP